MALIRVLSATLVTTNTVVTTTNETVAVTSAAVTPPSGSVQVVAIGWCQVTLSAATTTVTPRVRRGTLITSPLVGEANAENLKTVAGSTEPFSMITSEVVVGGTPLQYVFTVQMAGANANSTILQASLLIYALS